MKIRIGFVSNSSSSSFILPIKDVDDKITIEFSFEDIKKFINYSSESGIDIIITNEHELESYIIDTYGYNGETLTYTLEYNGEWLQLKYNEMLNYINNGRHLLVGYIDHNDQTKMEIISRFGGKVDM